MNILWLELFNISVPTIPRLKIDFFERNESLGVNNNSIIFLFTFSCEISSLSAKSDAFVIQFP